MELTRLQSKLLLEACQYEIQCSSRFSVWVGNLLLRLSGITPLDSFDNRMELLERFGFIKELNLEYLMQPIIFNFMIQIYIPQDNSSYSMSYGLYNATNIICLFNILLLQA